MTHHLFNPRIFILLLIATLLLSCGSELEINVSPGGDDNASGSRAHPFKTLARAQMEVQKRALNLREGTLQVILHDGVYTIDQPLRITALEAAGNDVRVAWKAAPGAKPIISGALRLEGKVQKDGTITAHYTGKSDLMDIYVEGQRAQRARTPSKGFFRFAEVKEEVTVRGEARAPEKAIQTMVLSEEANNQLKNLSDSALSKTRFHAFFKWDNTIRYLSGRGGQRSQLPHPGSRDETLELNGKRHTLLSGELPTGTRCSGGVAGSERRDKVHPPQGRGKYEF